MSVTDADQMRIAAIGECMVEVSNLSEGRAQLAFGGDTLNTALYMARLGANISYVTALGGDDPYSNAMVEAWQDEGIDTGLVRRIPERVPGLYAISTTATGERSFHYWRDRAPAREMLQGGEGEALAQKLTGFDLLYLSGITLSILDVPQRERLLAALAELRERGGKVAFDPNYRPTGWTDAVTARDWFDRAYALSTIALPTLDDEQKLQGDRSAKEIATRIRELGAGEVVVKLGEVGCLICDETGPKLVPVSQEIEAVDTTAAGDSFNAAYLSARMRGRSSEEAAMAGHALAGRVIGHPGAIIPKAAMADLMPYNMGDGR